MQQETILRHQQALQDENSEELSLHLNQLVGAIHQRDADFIKIAHKSTPRLSKEDKERELQGRMSIHSLKGALEQYWTYVSGYTLSLCRLSDQQHLLTQQNHPCYSTICAAIETKARKSLYQN